ncbi:MAG TPA: DUF3303 family protein [Acidimicrobiales bacterium]|nr:DUF3303 family protein [Acidimicrobiales bacterium]
MKRYYLTSYRYRQDLHEDDLRELTKKFTELGEDPGVLHHWARLDGSGGFVIEEIPDDPAESFSLTIQYSRWMEFEIIPVTTMEDAFPVIQRLYG